MRSHSERNHAGGKCGEQDEEEGCQRQRHVSLSSLSVSALCEVLYYVLKSPPLSGVGQPAGSSATSGEEKRDHVRHFHGGQAGQYTTRGHSAMRSSSRTLTAPKLSRNLSSAVGGAGDATAGSAATAASAACEPSDDAERDGVVLSDGAAEGSCARYK